jgi:hypothetical protein
MMGPSWRGLAPSCCTAARAIRLTCPREWHTSIADTMPIRARWSSSAGSTDRSRSREMAKGFVRGSVPPRSPGKSFASAPQDKFRRRGKRTEPLADYVDGSGTKLAEGSKSTSLPTIRKPRNPIKQAMEVVSKANTLGRPPDYHPSFCELAFAVSLKGVTVEELAQVLHVSIPTIETWYKKYPDFLAAVRRAKDTVDSEVEASLFKRATGFYHRDSVKVGFWDGQPVYAPYVEYFPPDPAAAKHWLANRQRARWGDKVPLQDPTGLTDEQLTDELTRRGVVIDGAFEVIGEGAAVRSQPPRRVEPPPGE